MLEIASGLITNVFVTFGGVFLLGRFLPLLSGRNKWVTQVTLGVLFGATAIVSMLNSFPIANGVYGDMRNALTAVAAIAAGPVVAIICTAIAAMCRIVMGGQVFGAVLGMAVCAAVSIAFRMMPVRKTVWNLVAFGSALAVLNAAVPFIGVVGGRMNLEAALPIAGAILVFCLLVYPVAIPLVHALLKAEIDRLDAEASLLATNAELTARERRFREVFDLSCVPMAWLDLGTRHFVRVNREYEVFTGYQADELEQMTIDQLSTPEDRQSDVETFEAMAAGKSPSINGERRYRRKDGSIRWGSRTLTATPDAAPAKFGLAIVQDITDRKRADEKVAYLAEHDPLTALVNRYAFNNLLTKSLNRVGSTVAVLLLDLDNFKDVNDTRGHAAGDEVLIHVADTLRSHLEADDVIGRVGGDEFAIIRQNTTPQDTLQLAERIVALVGEPTVIGGQLTSISTSCGIAMSPEDGADPAELLKKADIALYASKANGKSAARLFEARMEQEIVRREETRAELSLALARSELELEYQPLIDIRTGEVCRFEALLRWNHPIKGRVSPADFIPIAEESQAITAIGAWVLDTACSTAAGWPNQIGVAVNVSVRQFEPTLPLKVIAALAKSGLSPSRLQLEITESVLMQGSDENLEILREIRGLGVSIALDDFGTGFSSLSYLPRFPFDKLKVDRSFVSGAVSSEESRKIALAIVQLGHSLGMRVTAEGVETVDQYERMSSKGFDEVQGFLFSRPVPAREVGSLLEQLGPDQGFARAIA